MGRTTQTLVPEFLNPTPRLGLGVGLRTVHYDHVLENKPSVSWFEAVTENYIGVQQHNGGRPLQILEQVRKNYPIVLHGVSMSIASTDPLDLSYLKKVRDLYLRIEPSWVSDHLCWTGLRNNNLHDLLPVPFTEEALRHVVSRIHKVQDFFKRRIAIENVSSYFTYSHSAMQEWEFLAEVAERADCNILLDVNNVYVSSFNHGFDPLNYLNHVPQHRVAQFHLAGYRHKGDHLIDTHDHRVSKPVWKLYQKAVERFGDVPTLLEWDDHIPKFHVLENELAKARKIQEEVLGKGAQVTRSATMAHVETHPLA